MVANAVHGATGRRSRRFVVRVTHLINGLGLGGAEMVLARLIESTRGEMDATVISLDGRRGALADRIEAAGARVLAPDLRAHTGGPVRLARALIDLQPDVVQTWLYHADLLGGVAARIGLRRTPILWGVHTTELRNAGLVAQVGLRAGSLLSHVLPTKIVCCSERARDVHRRRGYAAGKMTVIDNGFAAVDVDADAAAAVRAELHLESDARLIGRPGRFHPQKDYETLFAAIERLQRRGPVAHLVLTGTGIDASNNALASMIERLPSPRHVHVLGERHDTDRLYGAYDVVVSSSAFGEAMPLIIGEAMAAGVPVVATDVGDSARLVGDTGWIVPARDPAALADALHDALTEDPDARSARRMASQRRVLESFGLQRMAQQYLDLYRSVVKTS